MKSLLSWLPILVAIVAVIGLFIQHKALLTSQKSLETSQNALKNSQEEFTRRLIADHQQRQNELSLSLWDSWETSFDGQTRDDVTKLVKWIKTIPQPGANVSRDDFDKWLNLFVKGNAISAEEYEPLVNATPDHIKKIFLSGSEQTKLPIQDIDRIRSSAVSFLNTMEKVAVAYQYEVGNRQILNYAFRPTIQHYAEGLQPFAERYRSPAGLGITDAWNPLFNLVLLDGGDWTRERPKATQQNEQAPYKKALTGK